MKKTLNIFLLTLVASAAFFGIAYVSRDKVAREVLWTAADKENERKAVERAVEAFNRKLMDIYSTGGLRESLAGFEASKLAKHEIFRDLGNLRNARLLMIYDMANLEIRSVTFIDSERAVARTFEEWNYMLQDADTRRPADGLKGLGRNFMYHLEKWQGKWSVVTYLPAEAEKGEGGDDGR